ncbi:MAG: amidohydrolase family protein [Acidobacteriaceae bacterium]
MSICAGIALLLPASSTIGQPVAPVATTKWIRVHEGTDFSVTVSPNHQTIIMDLQGLLWSLPLGGGQARQLTDALTEASHPSWSPNGDLVAFQSYAGGTFHIWTMRPDGSALHQITSGHGDDREPCFSPQGTKIAFSSDRAFKGSYDIWTVDLASGVLKQWTSSEADEFEPAWSPSGSEIAFVTGTGIMGRTIEAVTAFGKQRTVATLAGHEGRLESPSYSPDGNSIAYIQFSGSGLFMNSAHLMVSGLQVGKEDDAFPFPAAWLSPNLLLYTANGHLLKVDLQTKAETQIPFEAAIKSIRPQYEHKRYSFDPATTHQVKGIYAPALSPDGRHVAFIALNQLWVMEIGKTPRAITHNAFYKQGPQWSPDGKSLAYVSDKNGVENIYVVDLATGSERQVAPTTDSAQILPAWSPDGTRLAFQDNTGATRIVDIATGNVVPLAAPTYFPGRPAWSPDGKTIAMAAVKPYTKRFREGASQILTVDIATHAQRYTEPAPFESVTTRGEDGPVYSPSGKEMAFIMDDLLYVMPVTATGQPSGKAILLNNETSDAPTWSADSKHLLYLSDGKLRLLARDTGKITPVPVDLTYHDVTPHQRVLIHAGRFWKGKGPEEQKDVDILIVDNRIERIRPHTDAAPGSSVIAIDASHSTVLPGLWENHVHPNSIASIYDGDRDSRLWLAYGVTELRDLADMAYRAKERQEGYDSGEEIGPRLFPTGEAIDGERVYYSMMIPTTSEAQLYRELNRLKALDFDLVKLYVRLAYAWQVKADRFAHEQMGVETASHYLLPAISLGNDGMSHISATARTGFAYSRSFTGVSYEDVRKLLQESGMWTISTTFSPALYAEYPGMASDPRHLVAPPWDQTRLSRTVATANKEDQREALRRLGDEESTVASVLRSGGTILAGTDSPLDIPATSLQLNLRSQVKFGLQPWQALETVTYLPAKAYALDKDLGTLEPGKLADLIIVNGDPLTDISAAADVQCVMKNGFLHSVGEIIAPFVPGNSIGKAICGTR